MARAAPRGTKPLQTPNTGKCNHGRHTAGANVRRGEGNNPDRQLRSPNHGLVGNDVGRLVITSYSIHYTKLYDGVNKMSKSLGNYIGINDAPEEQFGKLMRISDELMWRYLELLSAEDLQTINRWRHEVAQGTNPMEIKTRLAAEIVTRYHGAKAAAHAHEKFATKYQRREIPSDIPEREVTTAAPSISYNFV